MTQEKMRKMISAIVAAATVLFVALLAYLIYQWITIAVLNNRIEKANEGVAYWTEQTQLAEDELDYKKSDLFKQLEAFKLGLIKGNK
jgi:hypothetical protein